MKNIEPQRLDYYHYHIDDEQKYDRNVAVYKQSKYQYIYEGDFQVKCCIIDRQLVFLTISRHATAFSK